MYDLVFLKPHQIPDDFQHVGKELRGKAFVAGDHCPEMALQGRADLLELEVLGRPADWVPGRPWPDRPWDHHTVHPDQRKPPEPVQIAPAEPAASEPVKKEETDGAVHEPDAAPGTLR